MGSSLPSFVVDGSYDDDGGERILDGRDRRNLQSPRGSGATAAPFEKPFVRDLALSRIPIGLTFIPAGCRSNDSGVQGVCICFVFFGFV